MAARYQVGATVYELAAEFGCHRATIAVRLKKVGIAMRRQSPTSESIDAIVRLYASELPLQEVGTQLGFCANMVRTCLQSRQVRTHGRTKTNRTDRSGNGYSA